MPLQVDLSINALCIGGEEQARYETGVMSIVYQTRYARHSCQGMLSKIPPLIMHKSLQNHSFLSYEFWDLFTFW
jgi:hypothetical protein